MQSLPSSQELKSLLDAATAGRAPTGNLSWLAGLIDHTLLKPGCTQDELRKVCEEAKAHHFATVCVRSENVSFCAGLLAGTGVKPIAVVGFHDGTVPTQAKVEETRKAIALGAQEIDMVLNPALLKARDHKAVLEDIRAVVETAGAAPVKVILETCLLSDEEKVMASALSKAAGAAFVKTSTGFSTGGATLEDVALMRRTVGADMGVKASGGVRTLVDALKMVQAGANRIGTSNGVAIVSGNSPKTAEKGVY